MHAVDGVGVSCVVSTRVRTDSRQQNTSFSVHYWPAVAVYAVYAINLPDISCVVVVTILGAKLPYGTQHFVVVVF